MDDNYSKLLKHAYELHVSNNLTEAESAYEKLLNINPDDIQVLNFYAQLNYALKNYDKALEIFNRLYEKTKIDSLKANIAKIYVVKNDYESAIQAINSIKEPDISALRILALALTKSDNKKEAISVYNAIVKEKEHNYSDLFNLSVLYSKSGDTENAIKYVLKSYSLNQNDIDILLEAASLYESLSQFDEAINFLLKAYDLKHDNNILCKIGELYRNLNNDEKALEYFNKILDTEPDNKNALLNIAALFKTHDKNQTIKILKEICEKYPSDTDTLTYLYSVYASIMNYKECLNIALKLIKSQPDNAFNYTIAGDAFINMYQYDEALDMYQKSVNIEPKEYDKIQIASILSNIGKVDEALKIVSEYPDNISARTVRMYIYLREKNLQEVKNDFYDYIYQNKGDIKKLKKRAESYFYKLNIDKKFLISEDEFSLIGSRLNLLKSNKRDKYVNSDWRLTGNNISGKRILVYNPHGSGDVLMFCRYIKDLKSICSEVILQVPNSFIDLFKYNFPEYKIYSNDDEINRDEYDFSTSYIGLLYDLNIDLHNIDGTPYLKTDNNIIEEKSKFKELNTKKIKAGLYWQGNPTILQNRSIKLEKILPLFDLKNVQFYSFQMSKIDFDSEELKKTLPLIDLSPYIKNYNDTAAFLKNMDVLITIDTSIANLSGALGVRTFLLLPFEAEWRWFYDTDKTPWYNSVKIFKQKRPNDWDEVIQRIKNELKL